MDKVKLVVKVTEILKKSKDDVHIIVKQDSNITSHKIALFPIQEGSDDVNTVTRYSKIPISDLKKDFRAINMGYHNSKSEQERKLYFGVGNATIIGDHNWAYECDRSELSEMKNFCKIRFNTNKFIYIATVDSIDNGDAVLVAVNDIIGYV